MKSDCSFLFIAGICFLTIFYLYPSMHLSLAKIPVLLIITANYFQSYSNSVNTLEPPLFTSLINYLCPIFIVLNFPLVIQMNLVFILPTFNLLINKN